MEGHSDALKEIAWNYWMTNFGFAIFEKDFVL